MAGRIDGGYVGRARWGGYSQGGRRERQPAMGGVTGGGGGGRERQGRRPMVARVVEVGAHRMSGSEPERAQQQTRALGQRGTVVEGQPMTMTAAVQQEAQEHWYTTGERE